MKVLVRLWERVLLYLPLLFMGGLALGTYWLVRTSPSVDAGGGVATPATGPDYYLEGFVLRAFDADGKLRTEVRGDKATHYPDNQRISVDKISIRSVDRAGQWTNARADRGFTDDAQTYMELRGDARVVREGSPSVKKSTPQRIEYRGEHLLIHFEEDVVRSSEPVELLRGNGDRFRADSLLYDNQTQTLQLQGRVRGTLVPHTTPTAPASKP